MRPQGNRLRTGPTYLALVCLAVSLLLAGCPSNNPNSSLPGECNVTKEPCSAILVPGVAISLDASPRPLRTMTELVFTVSLSDRNGPLTGAQVEMDLSMPEMYMGDHHLVLYDEGQGQYRANTVIPRCPSGKTLWRADVQVRMRDMEGASWFLFSVE